ncbi:MAG: hypothetical protein QGI93_03585, partial [Planctomycetota bacterium]|nr:hypothetical protein [Planctomycetota bacterium]
VNTSLRWHPCCYTALRITNRKATREAGDMDNDYYTDKKWCPSCEEYGPYLMSIEHSYCTTCGSEVRLFSDADWGTFQDSMSARRPKGGRPRNDKNSGRGRESA